MLVLMLILIFELQPPRWLLCFNAMQCDETGNGRAEAQNVHRKSVAIKH